MKIWMFLAIFFTFCAPVGAAQPTSAQQEKGYVLGSGDILSMSVWAGEHFEKGMQGKYLVLDSGAIEVPLIGQVQVSGMTEGQASNSIVEELKKYIVKPIVQLQVVKFNSKTVTVLGAVQRPGVMAIEGQLTLFDALAQRQLTRQKQGQGAWAAQKVHLQRRDGSTQLIDLEELLTNGQGNVNLIHGDMIFVSDGAYVYVSGKIKKSGAVPFRRGMMVTDAIAEAGGPQKGANVKEVYILRGGKRIRVNVKKIYQAKNDDVPLKEGDRLFIEESIW